MQASCIRFAPLSLSLFHSHNLSLPLALSLPPPPTQGLTWSKTGSNGQPSGTPTSESVRAGSKGDFTVSLPPASLLILTLPAQ